MDAIDRLIEAITLYRRYGYTWRAAWNISGHQAKALK